MKGLLRSFLVFQCEFSLIKSILSLNYIQPRRQGNSGLSKSPESNVLLIVEILNDCFGLGQLVGKVGFG